MVYVRDRGHDYDLGVFDDVEDELEVRLTFVKRCDPPGTEVVKYPGNEGSYPGTQMQEVMRVLIERGEYVNNQFPCDETTQALSHMRSIIYLLERRHVRIHEGGRLKTNLAIEKMPVCNHCGHITCYCPGGPEWREAYVYADNQ